MYTNLVLTLLFGVLCVLQASAAVTLPFSTTYNCVEQQQGDGTWVNCNGLEASGDNALPFPCQITSAANYSGGAGGRGMRTWWGYQNPTPPPEKNYMCAAPNIVFSSPTGPGEAWIRWYQRFESGWAWTYANETRSQKNMYFGTLGNTHSIWYEFTNGYTRIVVDNAVTVPQPPPLTNMFRTHHGGGTDISTGAWVCHEIHWKGGTTPSSADGELHWWADGVNYISATTASLGFSATGGLGYNNGSIPSNGSNYGGANFYQDVDDMAISTTGRIGCLSGVKAKTSGGVKGSGGVRF